MRLVEFDLKPGIGRNSQLNPKLWQQGRLDPLVRLKLLKTAELFRQFVDLDFPVLDLQITGAQAGMTYTDSSDLDLHIITDFSRIDCDQELAELFDTKRLLFKQQHAISIRGIPVEPGVEDINQPSRGSSYSLITEKWIRPPQTVKADFTASNRLADLLAQVITGALAIPDRQILDKVLKLTRKIRKVSLGTDQGEFHPGNIAYKAVRNQGLISDLQDRIRELEDQALSID